MNKKTRAVAILLVAVMILSLVASMIIPYLLGKDALRQTPREKVDQERDISSLEKGCPFFLSHSTASFALFLSARRL